MRTACFASGCDSGSASIGPWPIAVSRPRCCAPSLAVPRSAQAARRSASTRSTHPERRSRLQRLAAHDITWLDADTYLVPARRQRRRVAEGRRGVRDERRRSSTRAQMETALAALPGVSRDDAARIAALARPRRSTPTRTGALVTIGDDLYYYDFAPARAARLTDSAGRRRGGDASAPTAGWSPSSAATTCSSSTSPAPRERALTTDGGTADPQRQARLAVPGRDLRPRPVPRVLVESRLVALAFLQLDETPVPEYTVVDHIPVPAGARGHRLPEGRRSESDGEARRRQGRRRRPSTGSISSAYAGDRDS